MNELDAMDAELEQLAAQGGPRPLPASFSIEATHDEIASKEKGRPVYKDVEVIEIRVGRDVIRHPVTDEDRRAYAKQYLAWKKGQSDEVVEGFPLGQWSAIPGKALVRELAHFGIRTVEELATATDATLQLIGPHMGLRQKARDWVAEAEKQAPLQKLRDENASLQARLATLENMVAQQAKEIEAARNGTVQIAPPAPALDIHAITEQVAVAIRAQMGAVPEKPPKRRGRPPKNGVKEV